MTKPWKPAKIVLKSYRGTQKCQDLETAGKKSLLVLENGCKELTDDRQSRMALQFANCFLAQSGQKTYPCEESSSVSDCLSSIDSNGFTAYSEFFTHTHNMCQFLQHQI